MNKETKKKVFEYVYANLKEYKFSKENLSEEQIIIKTHNIDISIKNHVNRDLGLKLRLDTIVNFKKALNDEIRKNWASFEIVGSTPKFKDKMFTNIMEQNNYRGRSTKEGKEREQEIYKALILKKDHLKQLKNQYEQSYHSLREYKKNFQETKEDIRRQLNPIDNKSFNYYYVKIAKELELLPKKAYMDDEMIDDVRTRLVRFSLDLKEKPGRFRELKQDNVITFVQKMIEERFKLKLTEDIIMDYFSPEIQRLKNLVRYEI